MTRAFWKYYMDLTKFNLGLSLLVTFVKSPAEGILLFLTGGMLLSLVAYEYFHSHEYYLYYNLGLTRTRLMLKAWLMNLGISAFLGTLLFS
ncbi:hypothetical protein ACFS25_26895 [Spirosoma flavum]|uniref:Uncharacterized protein n=1 Tax=Spirosoma flavum TaxID=2048557 RepID=A0ABW6ATQ2_9BACT